MVRQERQTRIYGYLRKLGERRCPKTVKIGLFVLRRIYIFGGAADVELTERGFTIERQCCTVETCLKLNVELGSLRYPPPAIS